VIRRALAAVALLVGTVGLPGAIASWSGAAVATPTGSCQVKVGGPLTDTPWAQKRLDFQRAWPVSTGYGVVVAVIDTGLDRTHQQLAGIHVVSGVNVTSATPGADYQDCVGHGTSVTAIIAASRVDGLTFVGVAPNAVIVPVKQTDNSDGNADGIARGIDAAIAAHARVANISVTVTAPTPSLHAAMVRAARADLVIVAAAGNDGQGDNLPAYPAAYSNEFPNVIAVSASDAQDGIAKFADTGNYVTVAAPGVGVEAPQPIRGYKRLDGTSFAAPFVTGTVALILATRPELTAPEIRNRIEATADRPPATVPDSRYGYGIVDPYLAVTAVRDDTLSAPTAKPGAPLPAPARAAPTDRHLQHVALTTAVVLLALAVIAAAGVAVLRATRAKHDPAPTSGAAR
jgi:membrane-anchored mycosin MYCP